MIWYVRMRWVKLDFFGRIKFCTEPTKEGPTNHPKLRPISISVLSWAKKYNPTNHNYCRTCSETQEKKEEESQKVSYLVVKCWLFFRDQHEKKRKLVCKTRSCNCKRVRKAISYFILLLAKCYNFATFSDKQVVQGSGKVKISNIMYI